MTDRLHPVLPPPTPAVSREWERTVRFGKAEYDRGVHMALVAVRSALLAGGTDEVIRIIDAVLAPGSDRFPVTALYWLGFEETGPRERGD